MTEKNRLQEYCQKNKLPLPIYNSWSTGEPHKQQWSANVTIAVRKKNITINTIVASNSKSSSEKQAALMMLDHIKSRKNYDPEKTTNLSKLKQATKLSITSSHKIMFPNKLMEENKELIDTNSDSKNNTSTTDSDTDSDTDSVTDSDSDTIINVSEDDDSDKKSSKSDDDAKNNNYLKIFQNIYLIDLENKPSFRTKIKNNCLYIGFINSIHHSLVKYKHWYKCKSDDIAKELSVTKNNKLLYLIEGGTVDLVDHFMTAFIYPLVNFIQEQQPETTVYIISGDHAGWCTRACFEKILKWKKINNIEIINAASID